MVLISSIGAISSFHRKYYDVFYWKIDGFSTVSDKAAADDHYASPSFCNRYFKGNTWLRFYPNGPEGISGFIGLGYHSPYHRESSCVHLTLGLKTQSGRIEKWLSNYISFPQKKEFDSPALILQSEFLKRKEELAPSDCLMFVAILSPNVVEVIRDVGDRTETAHEEEEEDEEKKGAEKVIGDMGKLLARGDRSDATVLVREIEFKVHSCILAARTPVFAALFEHDTLEKQTRKITITDCDPGIFKEFLHYIYTGSVQNLTDENSLDLYRIADKYLVKDLKEVCRKCIQDSLCTDNFCKAVRLALMYKDEDLLENVFDYFAKYFRLIIRSVEWQRYIEENPREANEIFIRSLGPP